MTNAAKMGNKKLASMPTMICTGAECTPIFTSKTRIGAAAKVCIRKIGRVYRANHGKTFDRVSKSSKLMTKIKTDMHATIPRGKAIA